MAATFYIAALVALLSTLMVVTRRNTVHALLYLVVSLLAVAIVFYVLGAPFAAALEVIIYAGAIVVLFVFVVTMLNVDAGGRRQWLSPGAWAGPGILSAVLLAELCWVLAAGTAAAGAPQPVGAKAVGIALFGPYLLAVELASMLLLAGLVGAHHVGRHLEQPHVRESAAPGARLPLDAAP